VCRGLINRLCDRALQIAFTSARRQR
jgi:hypothetical protein